MLSLNAVFACDLLLVPVSCDYLALRGAREVERALNALEPVFKQRLPRRYLLTRYDMRRKMSEQVTEKMREMLRPEEICTTRIRESVMLAESPAVGSMYSGTRPAAEARRTSRRRRRCACRFVT